MPGQHRDPFVLLDDFRVAPPAGFPEHPHRGFEAFTYMIDGSFEHKDTLGHESRVSNGGTQRFTSGRGARHSEMPGEQRVNRGLQLWVNLPRSHKRMAPSYAAVHASDLPEESRAGAVVRTIVGKGSPVVLETEVAYFDLKIASGVRYEHELGPREQGLVYVADGRVKLGDRELGQGQAALLEVGAFELRALADARVFQLSGVPHGEAIVQRGPYVD